MSTTTTATGLQLVLGDGEAAGPLSEALARLRPPSGDGDGDGVSDGERPQVCIVPRVPGPAPLAALSDATLGHDLGEGLSATVGLVQHALELPGGPGSLVFVLPAAPTLGEAGSTLGGAFCGAILSAARTLAVELGARGTTVNTLLYGSLAPEFVAALAVQTQALRCLTKVTGQEIFIAAGLDGGRLRP